MIFTLVVHRFHYKLEVGRKEDRGMGVEDHFNESLILLIPNLL